MLMLFLFNWFLIQVRYASTRNITYVCQSNSSCGCSVNSAVLTKIIGGEEVKTDSWGWAISIRFRNVHICGGSLISSELILTAAHCLVFVQAISSLSITAGSKYLSIINQQRPVSEISIHRYYDSETYINDIAIIRVSSPFNMNDRSLAIVCLPPSIRNYPPNDMTVVAIGWGVLSVVEKVPSNVLQQVTLKTVASSIPYCYQTVYNESVQFCAGVEGGGKGSKKKMLTLRLDIVYLDTCQGDSGGPLMMFSDERWYVVGITSYGVGCGLPSYPGVYTRVSAYEKYITCFLKNVKSCIQTNFTVRNSLSSIITSFYTYSFYIYLVPIIIHFCF